MSYLPGVIEGFYGRPWPQAERLATVRWMAGAGLGSYVYAPKADAHLRRNWRQAHAPADWNDLLELRDAAAAAGVRFGVGFSPWGLQQHMTAADAAALREAVTRLNSLAPDLLCILFDDMPGGNADLAARQLAVVAEILSVSDAADYAVCPTYYSQDPVLEELFGACPEHYLQTLSDGLPETTAILWTGRRVISPDYRPADFEWLRERCRRPVILWDNCAANDGRLSSRHLRLRPFGSHPAELRNWCAGHWVNPMNQPELARMVLASLGELYRHPDRSLDAVWRSRLDASPALLGVLLERDADRFQNGGLDALAAHERDRLIAEYRASRTAAGVEIAAWLAGEYAFDPNCLND